MTAGALERAQGVACHLVSDLVCHYGSQKRAAFVVVAGQHY